jgi:hypothetical protein
MGSPLLFRRPYSAEHQKATQSIVKLIMKAPFRVIQVVCVPAFAGCSGETVTNSFRNYTEMQSSGIFEKGWLPRYLPKSAKNIKERHDLDSNIVTATFTFDPTDVESVKENCNLFEETEKIYVFSCDVSGNTATISLFKMGKAEYKSARKGTL